MFASPKASILHTVRVGRMRNYPSACSDVKPLCGYKTTPVQSLPFTFFLSSIIYINEWCLYSETLSSVQIFIVPQEEISFAARQQKNMNTVRQYGNL